MKQTRNPCPAARMAMPRAEVVLPFPSPVKTINKPLVMKESILVRLAGLAFLFKLLVLITGNRT